MPDPLLFDRDTPLLNRTFELLVESSRLAEQTYERIKQAPLLLGHHSLASLRIAHPAWAADRLPHGLPNDLPHVLPHVLPNVLEVAAVRRPAPGDAGRAAA